MARRDVPTCRIDETAAVVRDRIRDGHSDVCVVVDDDRVVLGLVRADSLDVDGGTPVEQVMESSPVTFRPDLAVGKLPDYVKAQRMARALVTTSDGVLVGLLDIEKATAGR